MSAPLIRCRDCVHWAKPHMDLGENYPRDLDPKDGYWTSLCKTLQHGIDITASGGWNGATVDRVETDANFACIYGQRKP